jgi:hypothetical protein
MRAKGTLLGGPGHLPLLWAAGRHADRQFPIHHAVGVPAALFADLSGKAVFTPVAVLFVGFVGGYVGLQRRLKTLPPGDLTLLANSQLQRARLASNNAKITRSSI